VHAGQQQASESMDVTCIAERFYLAEIAHKHGFLAQEGHFRAAIQMPLRMTEQALRERSLPEATRGELEKLARAISVRLA
jgi:hypothetical protein